MWMRATTIFVLVCSACAPKEQPAAPAKPPPDAMSVGEARARTPLELCEARDAEACFVAGGMALLGRGAPQSDPRAIELFELACEGGSASGCEALAKMYREGRSMPKDPRRSKELMEKACEHGAAESCRSVGMDALKDGDQATAVRLLTRACELRNAISCLAVGTFYVTGTGVARDLDKAREFLRRACNMGERAACDRLADLPPP